MLRPYRFRGLWNFAFRTSCCCSSSPKNGGQGGKSNVDISKVVEFFEQAEERIATDATNNVSEKLCLHISDEKAAPESPTDPRFYAKEIIFTAKKGDNEASSKRRQSTAVRLVPWTSNRFLKGYKPVKPAPQRDRVFATMLRECTFVQLGDFHLREMSLRPPQVNETSRPVEPATVDDGSALPPGFSEAVLRPSQGLPEGVNAPVRGYDFNTGVDFEAIMTSYASMGFQATHFARAVNILNTVIAKKNEKAAEGEEDGDGEADKVLADLGLGVARRSGCTVFLAYTSNMVSCGSREIIRFLVQHSLVDVLVTSAGGVEEDFVKCLAPFYVGDFSRWPGTELRRLGINRIGNLLAPNNNYVVLEQWLIPIFDRMLDEQTNQNVNWTPSKVIDRLGREIDNPESIYYWCHKNGIPVFCPGITDGSMGDVLFAHTYRTPPGLRVDVVADVRRINSLAIYSRATAVLVLGGGIVKHHTLNANLMRNGADFAVYVNTGQEFDGSDSGASPDEAVSWGKLRGSDSVHNYVKVCADASLIFPLLVAQTFAKHFHQQKQMQEASQ